MHFLPQKHVRYVAPIGGTAVRRTSILCALVFLLCLVALPIICYAGGRLCMPLTILLLPAEVMPLGIGFVAAMIIVLTVVRSFVARRHRLWAIGALAIVVVATLTFAHSAPRLPGFLHGLRDRFVLKVGYPKMREFAKEVSQITPGATIAKPGRWNSATPEDQKRWDDLVTRYPFLGWNDATGTAGAGNGTVGLSWGSALVGHWGFLVAPGGKVKAPEEDRCRILRVSEDILFVNTFD